ncbi:hypothetical protein VFPBJ_01273 [Purpureocillium lilacinum]|uniref:Uncharacterized protein n=1 Tax=Purpureocillium lilacinum TaxID=33203 RepID=A0A179HCP1_PURLI|nr:hypothetical protein VFPBJ_01273 [Purpureocillium lilacinum]
MGGQVMMSSCPSWGERQLRRELRASLGRVILPIRACDRGRALRSESLFSPAEGPSLAHCPLRRNYSLPGRGRAGEWAAGWLAGMHEAAATAAVACCDMDG